MKSHDNTIRTTLVPTGQHSIYLVYAAPIGSVAAPRCIAKISRTGRYWLAENEHGAIIANRPTLRNAQQAVADRYAANWPNGRP